MSSSSSNGKGSWGTEHEAALTIHIVKLVITHRGELYNVPEFAEFRGSKINQKIQQHLKKYEKGYPGDEGSTAAVIEGMKKAKSPVNSPKKGKGGGSPPKKRKSPDEAEESE